MIDVTAHAHIRILERTKMFPDDVRELLEADACVSLSHDDKAAFLMFYSQIDHDWFIAIMSHDLKTLISVWKLTFNLPAHVFVGHKHKVTARNRYYEFWFNKKLNQTIDTAQAT